MSGAARAVVGLVVLVPALACAAGKNPSLKGIPLDRAGLKNCVALEQRMRSKVSQYNAEVNASNARIAQGNARKGELDTLLVSVQGGRAEMSEYNAKVEDYNSFVNETADRKLVLAEIAVEHHRVVSEFNTMCANRPYRNSDLLQVKRRK